MAAVVPAVGLVRVLPTALVLPPRLIVVLPLPCVLASTIQPHAAPQQADGWLGHALLRAAVALAEEQRRLHAAAKGAALLQAGAHGRPLCLCAAKASKASEQAGHDGILAARLQPCRSKQLPDLRHAD
jgi:hypothetical protein